MSESSWRLLQRASLRSLSSSPRQSHFDRRRTAVSGRATDFNDLCCSLICLGPYANGQNTTSNFERLKQPVALVEEIDGVHLPRSIRDAMYLVRALGELFLWVDCLSLFQDETTERMDKSLQAMACIYASADFTIVAAGGADADSGLPGIGGPSEERTPSSIIRRCVGGRRHFRREGYPWASRWVQRGWTYQESLFARRWLVLDTLASWVCGRCVWLE